MHINKYINFEVKCIFKFMLYNAGNTILWGLIYLYIEYAIFGIYKICKIILETKREYEFTDIFEFKFLHVLYIKKKTWYETIFARTFQSNSFKKIIYSLYLFLVFCYILYFYSSGRNSAICLLYECRTFYFVHFILV